MSYVLYLNEITAGRYMDFSSNFNIDFMKRTSMKDIMYFCQILKKCIINKHENNYKEMHHSLKLLKEMLALTNNMSPQFDYIISKLIGPFCGNKNNPKSYCKKEDLEFDILNSGDDVHFVITSYYYNRTFSYKFLMCIIKWREFESEWMLR